MERNSSLSLRSADARRRRSRCGRASLALAGLLAASGALAASLEVDDGVVVKFGNGSGLVVRERLTASGHAVID